MDLHLSPSTAFAEWLLRSSWQATLLAALVLVTQQVVGQRLSAAWKHALWMLVVARLALPVLPQSPLSLYRWLPSLNRLASSTDGERRDGTPRATSVGRTSARTKTGVPGDPATPARQQLNAALVQSPPAPTPTLARDQNLSAGAVTKGNSLFARGLRIFLFGWATGVFVLLARFVVQNLRFTRQIGGADVVSDPEVVGLLDACRSIMGVRRLPLLLETEAVQTPALYGWLRPRLLLPRGMSRGFKADELRFVFLHELAHLKRWDMPLNWLATLLRTVHWFNPFLGFAFHQLQVDRELATDSLALAHLRVGENRSYGNTILKIVADLNRPSALPGLVGILEDKRQLTKRLRMIAGYQNRPASRWAAVFFLLLACVALTDAEIQIPSDGSPVPQAPVTSVATTNRIAPPVTAAKPTKVLVQDGRILFEMGKYDEAESKLQEALRQEPENREASYYLEIIERRKIRKARSDAEDRTDSAGGTKRESAGRARIYQKLDRIVLPGVAYDGIPLRDVVKDLVEQARENDPDATGVNFLIDPGDSASDPASDHVDVGNLPIRLRLRNVRLGDVLDSVTKVSETPLRYQVFSDGIIFSLRPAGPQQFFTRVYHLDPATLSKGLRDVNTGTRIPEKSTNVVDALRSILAAAGVDFAPDTVRPSEALGSSLRSDLPPPAGRVLIFNQRTGVLLVRATLEELDTTEKVIQLLNTPEAQVTVEVKLVELSEAALKSKELEWLLDPGVNRGPTNRVPVLTDVPVLGRLFRSAPQPPGPSPAQLAGILTAPQFRTILTALKARADVKVLFSPNVTTLSRRPAEVKIAAKDAIYRVTVVPYVHADGSTVDTTVFLRVQSESHPDSRDGVPTDLQPDPLMLDPATAVLWDGQTVVLGPFHKASEASQDVGLPASWGVREFSSSHKASEASQDVGPAGQPGPFLLFVTPTLIDPAGNRVHSDDQPR